jgi:hypothetical protein
MLSASIQPKKHGSDAPSSPRNAPVLIVRYVRRIAAVSGYLAMNCWHCGRTIEIIAGKDRVGFRDDCPGCNRALHVCLNCALYDLSYNNSCREPMAERVVDKDRFNFCEYFTPADNRKPVQSANSGKSGAQNKLEDLFKKK